MTKEAGNGTDGELINAVHQLTAVVKQLQKMIEDDYPKRHEIERDFVSKYGIAKKRRQLAIAFTVAIVASFFWTMGTVSYCLLGQTGEPSKLYCKIIPGYSEAIERNDRLIARFNDLIATTEANRARIEEMEKAAKP